MFFVAESCSYDDNSEEAIIEKGSDGLEFSFWLSDMDDKRTNIFDEKDIKERGFYFNMSLTNNSDKNIYITNGDIMPFLSEVFDTDSNYIGRSCAQFTDIYILYKIQPGETHYESLFWCRYNVNTHDAILLPAGNYYTYFSRSLTYKSGDNYDLKTIEIPPMYINFEVK